MTRTPLGRATLIVVAAHLLHDLDHIRQGRSATTEVGVAAALAWVSTLVLVFLVARRHRLAPLFAATFGVVFAAGFVLVHGLPHWSAFSDSYGDARVDALSWVLAAVPVAAGLLLAYRGADAMRRAPGATVAAPS
jgi:uncharacterized protein (TIGR03382 family)